MAIIRTVSLSLAHEEFITKHKISPSAVMQEKIDELMKIKDPQLLQRRLLEIEEKNNYKQTEWQKRLSAEADPDKRMLLNFAFLESIGVDTSDWKERIECAKRVENG